MAEARERRRTAARRLRKAVQPPPRGLEVVDVGDVEDGWVVLTTPAPTVDDQSLTPALRDVLAGVLAGETNAAIAARRGVSRRTVDNQVATLLARYGARSRVDLVRAATRPK